MDHMNSSRYCVSDNYILKKIFQRYYDQLIEDGRSLDEGFWRYPNKPQDILAAENEGKTLVGFKNTCNMYNNYDPLNISQF